MKTFSLFEYEEIIIALFYFIQSLFLYAFL